MKTKLLITSALLAASIAVPSALAADKIWDGGAGNGTWTAPNNWDLNTAPVPTDSLFFAGSVQTSTNNGFTANTQFNGLTFNAGASSFTLAGNAINLAGNITNSSSNNQTVNLALALQQNTVVDTGASGTTTLGGNISGAFSLTKNGAGLLTLAGGDNTGFSGPIIINEGVLQATQNNTPFGTGTLTMANGTTIKQTNGNIYGVAIVPSYNGAGINVANGATVTFDSVVFANMDKNGFSADGSYGNGVTIVKTGAGSTRLGSATTSAFGATTANTFRVDGGEIQTGNEAHFGSANNDIILNGGGLNIWASATISSGRTITLNNVAGNYFKVGDNNSVLVTLGAANQLTGSGDLNLTGKGALKFTAAQNYTGKTVFRGDGAKLQLTNTTIDNSPVIDLGTSALRGTLQIDGPTTYTFGTGQTISGYGTINIGTGKTVTIAGTLAPGNSPGVTTVTGNLAFASTTATALELAGLGGVAGTDFDQVNVSGSMAYGGNLTITSYNGWDISQIGTYNLFDFSSYSGNFDSVMVGGFAMDFVSGNWTKTTGGKMYSFTLSDGVLAVAVPEPAAWMLLAAAGTFFMVMRRRRSD